MLASGFIKQMTCAQFCCLICEILVPGKLLPSLKEAVAVSSTKTSAVWLAEFSCATLTKSLKEAVADPTWIQSTIIVCANFYVLDNVVYMGTVNNSNKT